MNFIKYPLRLYLKSPSKFSIVKWPIKASYLRNRNAGYEHFHTKISYCKGTCLNCALQQRSLGASFYCTKSESKQTVDTSIKNENVDVGEGTWEEIYRGILTTQIKLVKTFSLSTSAFGLLLQPVLLEKIMGSNFGVLVAMGTFIGFFTLGMPFLIHFITRKYVTHLNYDPGKDVYSATTLSFFLRETKIVFGINDVKVPDVPGLFTTFLAKRRPLFVDPSMFTDLSHYGRLMGYDKPIDLHLTLTDKNEQKGADD